jgi:peptidylamidoglycolate lyase
MDRRNFIGNLAIMYGGSKLLNFDMDINGHVYGHGNKKYIVDQKWANQIQNLPVKDCHEMVQNNKGEIILLTNETKNNIIVFDKSGSIKRSWGQSFPGAHGLTIHGDEDQTLFITDTELNQFFQTSIDGKILKTWDFPIETKMYSDKKKFVPTETAITKNGEIYVADGYGMQYIIHYDSGGNLKNIFGGSGIEDRHLDNAHGICIDYRNEIPSLIVTDRNKCCFKRFTMGGDYVETISLPGANVCRPVIKGDYLYAAVLTSDGKSNTGFVVILDKNNKLISAIGGSTPLYENGKCKNMYQTTQLFKHPHDVLVDDEENLYVCQWNSNQVYPIKFIPYV